MNRKSSAFDGHYQPMPLHPAKVLFFMLAPAVLVIATLSWGAAVLGQLFPTPFLVQPVQQPKVDAFPQMERISEEEEKGLPERLWPPRMPYADEMEAAAFAPVYSTQVVSPYAVPIFSAREVFYPYPLGAYSTTAVANPLRLSSFISPVSRQIVMPRRVVFIRNR